MDRRRGHQTPDASRQPHRHKPSECDNAEVAARPHHNTHLNGGVKFTGRDYLLLLLLSLSSLCVSSILAQ